MDVNNNLQKIIYEKDEEQLKETQKDIDINSKEIKQKNSENTKKRITNKNNEKEVGNKRVNNFVNAVNSNGQHNRYYSTITSKNYFRNFVKKTNYNKNKENAEDNNEQRDFDIDNHFNEIRPFSFTSKNNLIKNYYMSKGLDYFLGGTNPNNIYNKGFIDNKKSGYNYKNYVRGKRNNYVNKNIFFNQNKIKNNPNMNELNTNYYKEGLNLNPATEQKPNYILMKDILKMEDINIMNIAKNIFSNIGYKNLNIDNDLLHQYLFN